MVPEWNLACTATLCVLLHPNTDGSSRDRDGCSRDKEGHRFASEFMLIKTIQQAKRWTKIVFGFTLLALGVIMIITPGPGWLTILLGLGILAAEFVWARTLLDRLKEQGMRLRDVFVRQPAGPTTTANPNS
jgi:hypothetical protein